MALIGPAGTDLGEVVEVLEQKFLAVDYKLFPIRLSELLRTRRWRERLSRVDQDGYEDARIREYQRAGDELRAACGDGAALAYLAMQHLYVRRGEYRARPKHSGRVFAFNSLKHPDEVTALRKIFGDCLLVVGVYAPKGDRVRFLARRIQRTRGGVGNHTAAAERIIEDDEHTADPNKLAQNVRDAFPLADVFVAMNPREQMELQLQRAVRLWFGAPFETPTRDEQGMFVAHAAGLRSADLSRQVGAAIADARGDILALGCNEVPKASGGAYWHGDDPDYRDFHWGADTNQVTKRQIVGELVERLRAEGLIDARSSTPELLQKMLDGKDAALRGTRIASLIEFGRVVHAEMHAILDASRRGIPLAGATLLCTTYPCHMCARHIIAAGVVRVVYIEPYPKSLTKDLYGRTVAVDNEQGDDDSVRFMPFVGVAPRSYLRLFEAATRKDSFGYPMKWCGASALPRVSGLFAYETKFVSHALDWADKNALTFDAAPPTTGESDVRKTK